MKKPRIVITMGDPSGIGPEITAKALGKSAVRSLADFTVVGDRQVYSYYKKSLAGLCFRSLDLIGKFSSPGQVSIFERGQASYAYLQAAIKIIAAGDADALVTAPINKTAVIESGVPDFRGHTEMLADAFHVKHVEMMFTGGPFKTIIATRHIPLREVASSLTRDGLVSTIRLADQCLRDVFKIRDPRIAVCGVNPHAGEGGKIGREEIDCIQPAIESAQAQGICIEGPLAADTLFIPFNARKYDLIIAMYHDQGLSPIKAMYFKRLVNLTVGLPFIRTSTAHGTAEDIAGKKIADPSSMIEAILLACHLARKAEH